MEKKPKILFILGGPGSGKGTMCELLKKKYKFQHLSTGELLRSEVKKKSKLGIEIENYIKTGKMVPGDIPVKLIKNEILKKSDNKNLFILDGYPRNKSNIIFWEKVIKNDFEVIGCLFLECSENIMKKRILNRGKTSGRSDDNEEIFKKRINVFFKDTLPILKYFENLSKLFKISANGTKQDCFLLCQEIVKKLNLENLEIYEKIFEMKNYLKIHLDCYLEPLIDHVLKNRPDDVYSEIKIWLDNEGEKIRQGIEKDKSIRFV